MSRSQASERSDDPLHTQREDIGISSNAIAGVQGALAGNFTAIGIGDPEILHQAHLIFAGISHIDPKIFSFDKISQA